MTAPTTGFLPRLPNTVLPADTDTRPAGLDRGRVRVLADHVARAATSDDQALEAVLDELRSEERELVRAGAGRPEQDAARAAVLALAEVTVALREHRSARLPRVRAGSELARLLLAIASKPAATSEELSTTAGLDVTAVSRTGRRAIREGLATPNKYGRVNSWQLTDSGKLAVNALALDAPAPRAKPATKAASSGAARPAPAKKAPASRRGKAPKVPVLRGKKAAPKVPLKAVAKKAASGKTVMKKAAPTRAKRVS